MQYPPVEPAKEIARWTAQLTQMASQPLEFCPQFPRIAQRFEAWWAHEVLDRPIFFARVNTNRARKITRHLELLNDPERWFQARFEDLKQYHHVGDAIPHLRADFGPVMLGGLLGARVEFISDTTWTHPCINDEWSNEPSWSISEDNPWWKQLGQLLDHIAQDAAGRYLVCTPDLGGTADVLLNLRGSEALCLDAVERPARIAAAVDAIYPSWRKVWRELYRRSLDRGAGVCHWLTIWSNQPYMVPACDFNFMIGPAEFQKLFLPDIARQAATAGRAVFHLDGPGAARHIDSLLEVPEIQAIQFTPGEGTPSALPWIEMFRKIQAKGRSLYIFAMQSDIDGLCDALKPEGLALVVSSSGTPKDVDSIFDGFCRRYGAKD